MNEAIDELVARVGPRPDQPELLALLREAQALCGALTPELQRELAGALQIAPGVIAALVRVTPALRETACRHVVTVCIGRHCRAKGSFETLRALQRALGVETGGASADGLCRLETRACLKRCADAPNLLLDGRPHPWVTPDGVPAFLQKLRQI